MTSVVDRELLQRELTSAMEEKGGVIRMNNGVIMMHLRDKRDPLGLHVWFKLELQDGGIATAKAVIDSALPRTTLVMRIAKMWNEFFTLHHNYAEGDGI